jgi:hypothetical protein
MRSGVRIAFLSRLHFFSKWMQMQKRDLHLVVLSVKESLVFHCFVYMWIDIRRRDSCFR